jgi:hypothetical protein
MSVAEKLTAIAENQQRVFDAGKDAGSKAFWDAYQQSGKRTTYVAGFAGYCWNDTTYNPLYPVTATDNSNYLFWHSRITNTKVPVYTAANGVNGSSVFSNCSNLVTIPLLVVTEDSAYGGMFSNCTKLQNITIEGVIGKDFSITAATGLSDASLMNIVDHLKDYAGTGTTRTLSVGTTNIAKLERLNYLTKATSKGWTVT